MIYMFVSSQQSISRGHVVIFHFRKQVNVN